jgi:peptidyl-prolyl cis-trans isomerase-like protein 2
VAIRPSGNVYAMDAINELNIKHKNWTDLMTGEPFTRKDVSHGPTLFLRVIM